MSPGNSLLLYILTLLSSGSSSFLVGSSHVEVKTYIILTVSTSFLIAPARVLPVTLTSLTCSTWPFLIQLLWPGLSYMLTPRIIRPRIAVVLLQKDSDTSQTKSICPHQVPITYQAACNYFV